MIERETFIKNNEVHYVRPLSYYKGNHTKCYQCLYYKQHEKKSRYHDGECTSVCHNTERGYSHNREGNDFTSSYNDACGWFFLKGDINDT